MPTKTEEPNYSAEVDWITRLPNGGGAWGKGIVDTVCEIQGSKELMEKQRDELTMMINGHKKLLRSMLVKADKESTMLFANSAIAAAKGQETA